VFAPKVARAQTKAAESPTGKPASQHSTLVMRPFGSRVVELPLFLQRSIGNQATLRLLSQRGFSSTGEEAAGDHKQEAGPASLTARGATPGVSWDFSKIPIFSPERANRPQTLKPRHSEEVSKVARNPDESSPTPVPAAVHLDAPAFKEQEANSSSSIQVTSPFAGSPPTFENIGFAALCQSPLIALAGQISVPPARANGDLTVGFMQTLVDSTGPTGRYFDDNDAPYMSGFQPYATLPIRDADPSGVFYGPEAQHDVDSITISVSMKDRPQAALLWTTPDGNGKLQQIVGEDQFVTWLATKSDSTGKIEPLRYIRWSVDWFAAVDRSEQSGTPFGVGKITEAGGGQGPMAPIRSGPVANDSHLPTEWKPWK
jgi:hypothetical protein